MRKMFAAVSLTCFLIIVRLVPLIMGVTLRHAYEEDVGWSFTPLGRVILAFALILKAN